MTPTFIQSTGKGDNVICLHSSMSSSRQWKGLMQRLRNAYQVTAVDLHGYGNGPELAAGATWSLDREVTLLADLIAELQGPIHLVGHSYGGAVAIKAAQTYTRRITSLTLYEPVIFAALFDAATDQASIAEIIRLIENMQDDYRCGDLFRAAQRFIDYWSGAGSWDAIPYQKQRGLAHKVPVVLGNFEAVIAEADALAGLANLQLPTLYLAGRDSPAAAQAISALLKQQLPQADMHYFSGMGHMGPITHSDIVNDRIESFIQRRTTIDQDSDYAQAA